MIRFIVVFALFIPSVSAFSMAYHEKKQLFEQIKSIPVLQDRISSVRAMINGNSTLKQKITALEAVVDRNRNDDPEEITAFLQQVGNDSHYDVFVRARALKSAHKVYKNTFNYVEARQMLEQAYALQPTRTDEEKDQKADMKYQIGDDEWAAGNYETALREFIEFGSQYPGHNRFQLQLFAYFEVIPKLTRLIQSEIPESQVVSQLVQSGLISSKAGEVFGAAMIQYGQEDFNSALDTAEIAVKLSNDPRWTLYRDLLEISVLFLNDEQEQVVQKLDTLAANPESDNWLTYYIRIMGMMISEFHAEAYGDSYPIYDWYVSSPIYTDAERREGVSGRSLSHILLNYAIDMMYVDRDEESFELMKNLYLLYFDKKHGKAAGLIVAEEYIKRGNLERTEGIINSVMQQAEMDTFIGPRSLLVLSQLKRAQGSHNEADNLLQQIINMPERDGDEDLDRAKTDAKYFLGNVNN